MKNINDTKINKQEIIESLKEKIRAADRWVNQHRAISLIITAIVIIYVFSFFMPAQNTNTDSNSNQDTSTAPVISEQTKQALADSFCTNRTGKHVGHVSLDDFSSMLESGKETMLHVTYQAPSSASCQKITEDCLSSWPLDDCQKIANKQVWIGMSKNELLLSWGFPIKKNDTVGSWGIDTQWIYGDYSQYVYLRGDSQDNLTVYSWQSD